jgi:hypothetical protein
MVHVGVNLTYVGRSDEAITLVCQAMRDYDYFRSCTRSEMTSSMNGLSLAPTLALGK